MKKEYILLSVTLLMLLAMAGCSKADQSENQAQQAETTAAELTTEAADVTEPVELTTEAADVTENQVTVDTAEVDGIEMAYCTFGHGEKTFVILPGLSIKPVTASAEAVAAAYADFSQDYTVYLFDRRSNNPADYSIEDMAEDTVTVMKSLGLDQIDVFGASQGGMIAEVIALNHPDMVDKMILGSSCARITDKNDSVISQWLEYAEEKKAYELNESMIDAIYSEATLSAYRDSLLAGGNDISEEEMERFTIYDSAILEFDVYDRLGDLKADTLVIGCEGDKVLGVEASQEIADQTGCELYIYGEEYGHGVYDEAPDYRSHLIDFLKK